LFINQKKTICCSFYFLKVDNELKLSTLEGYNTLHTSSSAQTLVADPKAMFPSDVGMKRTIDGAYDNPLMSVKL
jgi:hypothetical protein